MLRFIAGIALWLSLSVPAVAQSWDDRIAAAKARAAEIEAYAARFDADYNGPMGRMLRWADLANVECMVLAETVGLGDISGHLQFMGQDPSVAHRLPPTEATPDTPALVQLLEYAWNLRAWARDAETLGGYSDDQRAELWELSCNGQHGIPEGLLPKAWKTEATFRLSEGTLQVLGDITPGFFEAFKQTVTSNGVQHVTLGSRGGSVQDAMQAGGLIRQLELGVSLHGNCESACPLIYFAGKGPRVMGSWPLYGLGFHQISNGAEAIPLDSRIYETIGAYVAAMGVDADFVLDAMRRAGPDEMYFPGGVDYCDAGFAVAVFEQCNWPYRE